MIKELTIKNDTNEEYHNSDSISASGLKKIHKKSVYHFLNTPFQYNKSMIIGSAIHTLFLEGSYAFHEQYYKLPNLGDLRTKKAKDEKKEHMLLAGKKEILTQDDYEVIEKCYEQFEKHDLAVKYSKGIIEQSHYGKFEGIPVRVRPDVIDKDKNWIADIKTCQDNSPAAFRKDLFFWRYHLQCAFYSDCLGIPAENFRFIAIETKPPYTTEVYCLTQKDIEYGRDAYDKALKDWRFYLVTGTAKGYQAAGFNEDGSLIL